MGRSEIFVTRWGEMLDMIACQAIYNGAEYKNRTRVTSTDEMLEVR